MNISFWYQDKEYKLTLNEKAENDIQVSLGSRWYDVAVETVGGDEYILKIDGEVYDVIIASDNANAFAVYLNGKCIQVEKKSAHKLLGGKNFQAKKQDVTTSMPGRIVKILLEEGSSVKEDQAVLILEAMKMQNEIKSPQAGRIAKIGPEVGDSVEAGALLFTVE